MRSGKIIFVFLLIALLQNAPICFAQNETLRSAAEKRGFYIGTAVAINPLRKEKKYRETVEREFNILVAENAFKWGLIHPKQGKPYFKDTDFLVEFAEKNGMKLRGHTLVWHRQNPKWLLEGKFTRDELIGILKNHIQTVVGRYRGKIAAWDVINEAIDDQTGNYRTDSFWYKNLGADYIKLAFQFAREADPNAKLYYNDYSAEGMNAKSDGVYKLLKDLKSQGVPVDGIGWQAHFENGFRIEPQHHENAERLAALGLELAITELDVRVKLPADSAALQTQAAAYRDVAEFCLARPNCKAVLIWGFTDKYSWIPGEFRNTGDALIFDTAYNPKPAYKSLQDSLIRSAETSK